jgi:transcriptional regulator with XRE-family HTH domain
MIRQSIIDATGEENNARVNRPHPDPRDIIRRLRLERGFRSDRSLAIAAGVNQPTLARYLSKESATMEVASFLAIAKTLGVTLSELIGEVPLGGSIAAREVMQLAAQMDDATRARWARVGRALLEDDAGPSS